MIYIISNNKHYSDHAFYFVSTFDNFDMQAFLDAMHEEHKRQWNYEMTKWTIEGTCEKLETLPNGRINYMTHAQFLDHINAWVLYEEVWNPDFRKFLKPPTGGKL